MIELNKDNFANYTSKGIVLVDFWSESCERCKEIMPDICQLEESFGKEATFCSLNIQANRRLAMEQKVMGLPSVVIWRDGERMVHLSGESVNEERIRTALEELLREQ